MNTDRYYSEIIQGENVAEVIAGNLTSLKRVCHGVAVESGWWTDLDTGEKIERNHGELFALIHSEISEAMEAHRKGKMDDHLTHRQGVEVELADTVIRILDYCGANNIDIGGALVEKLQYNVNRADHKLENRKKADGKKY